MWESSKNSAAFPDYPSMEMVIFLISVCEIAGLPKGRMIAHSPFFLTHTPMGPYVRDSRIPGPPDCYGADGILSPAAGRRRTGG